MILRSEGWDCFWCFGEEGRTNLSRKALPKIWGNEPNWVPKKLRWAQGRLVIDATTSFAFLALKRAPVTQGDASWVPIKRLIICVGIAWVELYAWVMFFFSIPPGKWHGARYRSSTKLRTSRAMTQREVCYLSKSFGDMPSIPMHKLRTKTLRLKKKPRFFSSTSPEIFAC